MKRVIVSSLINIANKLDNINLIKEANEIDNIIKEVLAANDDQVKILEDQIDQSELSERNMLRDISEYKKRLTTDEKTQTWRINQGLPLITQQKNSLKEQLRKQRASGEPEQVTQQTLTVAPTGSITPPTTIT